MTREQELQAVEAAIAAGKLRRVGYDEPSVPKMRRSRRTVLHATHRSALLRRPAAIREAVLQGV